MMGIVPVKIQGSIEANEPFYASPDYPGVATSAFHLTFNQINEATSVGYAFQSHVVQDENEVILITLLSTYLTLL